MDVCGISRAGSRSVFGLLAAITVLTACESRFTDKTPDNSGPGITFESLRASEDLDERLARIESTTTILSKIVRDFRRIQKAQSGQDMYTQLDFMFDLNKELKGAPAVKEGNQYVKYGRMEMRIPGISPECKMIETKLSTFYSGFNEAGTSDGLSYSVKTCKTNGQFVDVLAMIITPWGSDVRFNNEGIKSAFLNIFEPTVQLNSQCKLQIKEGRLESATCENVSARVSASENILFEKFKYSSSDELRFLATGTVTENEKPKYTVFFSIDKQDKPSFRFEAVK